MIVPIQYAVYLALLGAALGFVVALCWVHRDRDAKDHGFFAGSSDTITHIARRNVAQISEKQNERIRTLIPAFAEMQDATIASDRHAEDLRRELAPGLPASPIFPTIAEATKRLERVK